VFGLSIIFEDLPTATAAATVAVLIEGEEEEEDEVEDEEEDEDIFEWFRHLKKFIRFYLALFSTILYIFFFILNYAFIIFLKIYYTSIS